MKKRSPAASKPQAAKSSRRKPRRIPQTPASLIRECYGHDPMPDRPENDADWIAEDFEDDNIGYTDGDDE